MSSDSPGGGRTFAVGDIHGDLAALTTLLGRLPQLTAADTVVLLGDYLDRGPQSAQVMAKVRGLGAELPAKVVALRGNHEDAWLQVVDKGWPEFIMPRGNGCLETMRSYTGRDVTRCDDGVDEDEYEALYHGTFFPADDVAWMRTLPYWYEDEHAIYVHAGIKRAGDSFPHPSKVEPQRALLWLRDRDFFENYRGKLVVFGHTNTGALPAELSTHTPDDPEDLWAGPGCVGLDTRCGKGGYLTAIELPSRAVYESR
ncbi:MAG: metallophosphoesterase family protein [Kofleriaceae bacterium]